MLLAQENIKVLNMKYMFYWKCITLTTLYVGDCLYKHPLITSSGHIAFIMNTYYRATKFTSLAHACFLNSHSLIQLPGIISLLRLLGLMGMFKTKPLFLPQFSTSQMIEFPFFYLLGIEILEFPFISFFFLHSTPNQFANLVSFISKFYPELSHFSPCPILLCGCLSNFLTGPLIILLCPPAAKEIL